MNNELLAPPTKEELEKISKISASPVSKLEQKQEESEESSSLGQGVEDVLAGTAQGATFGFGDEILGAAQAAKEVATTDKSIEDLISLYRMYQKQNEEAYKQMQERSPWLTGAGELVGGFAVPGGLFLKGAKAATAAVGAKATQKALAAGKTVEEAAKAAKSAENLSKVIQTGKAGAGVGFLSGIGSSEKTLEETPELIKEGLTGAVVGGATGAAFAKGGQFIKSYIEESPKIQRALRVFELEKGGTNLTTEEGQDKVYKEFQDASKSTVDELYSLFDDQKKELNKVFEKHGKDIIQNPKLVGDFYNLFANKNIDAGAKNLIVKTFGAERASKIINGDLTLSDLDNIRRNILSMDTKKLADVLGSDGLEFLFGNKSNKTPGFIDTINDAINKDNRFQNIPILRENIKEAAMPVEQLLTKTDDVASVHKRISDYSEEQVKDALQKIVSRQIERMGNLGWMGVQGRGSLGYLKTLKDAEQKLGVPGLSEKIEERLRSSAKDVSALKSQIGDKPFKSDEGFTDVLKNLTPSGLVGGGFAHLAGKIGRTESNLGQPVSKLLKMGKATTAQLEQFANILKNSNKPVIKQLGEGAAAAFENGDAASKAAILNSIMQNPDAREILGVNTGEE